MPFYMRRFPLALLMSTLSQVNSYHPSLDPAELQHMRNIFWNYWSLLSAQVFARYLFGKKAGTQSRVPAILFSDELT